MIVCTECSGYPTFETNWVLGNHQTNVHGKGRGLSKRVLDVVKSKPGLTKNEIAVELDWSPAAVARSLSRLNKNRKVKHEDMPYRYFAKGMRSTNTVRVSLGLPTVSTAQVPLTEKPKLVFSQGGIPVAILRPDGTFEEVEVE